MLANISFTGMRAQNNPNALWRTLALYSACRGRSLPSSSLLRTVTARTASICRGAVGHRSLRLQLSRSGGFHHGDAETDPAGAQAPGHERVDGQAGSKRVSARHSALFRSNR
jgi:hypothetical protein